MAFVEIPTDKTLTSYSFSLVINLVLYNFDINYNSRMDRYTLNVLDSENNIILAGIPILTNVTLTDNFKYLDIPKGDFIPFSADSSNAGLEDLGDTVRLYYNGD